MDKDLAREKRNQRDRERYLNTPHRRHTTKEWYKRNPLWSTWHNMLARCTNKKSDQYKNYGGRGITVCAHWQGENGYKNFLVDVGIRPKNTTLDRIDNDGNYEPCNIRWATWDVQLANRRIKRLENFSDEELLNEIQRRGLKNG